MNDPKLQPSDCWNHIGVWGKKEQRCPKLLDFSHCRNCLVYIRAGRKKLDQPVPEDYDMAWVDTWLTEQHDDDLFHQQRLLVFCLNDSYFALPLIQVREVLLLKVPTPLPHSNTSVLHGLTHVRGELCLYISLCGFLAMPHISMDDKSEKKRLIYSNIDEQALVFPVDHIHGIIPYHNDALQPLPDSMPSLQRKLSKGLMMMDIHHQAQHVCVLDTTGWGSIMEHLR
ncbi:MAG: chemotaxis protein CheW [Mariprofundaceae bacterium]|nr:chemotaxis protein CheW [Mariprofundaceae bacterium]